MLGCRQPPARSSAAVLKAARSGCPLAELHPLVRPAEQLFG